MLKQATAAPSGLKSRPQKKKKSMSDSKENQKKVPIWLWPLWILVWPFAILGKWLYKNFLSYMIGRVIRDKRRIYTIKFIWYGDAVYLHPMVWGSAVLGAVGYSTSAGGWLLLIWLAMLFFCILTVMYNFDVIRTMVLLLGLVAFFALAYVSTVELAWNPLTAISGHIEALAPTVSPGFYIVACYVFGILIFAEVVWAWLFHRIELDESYVYEHRFLQGTTREPIFARGLKRETKDLLELVILGAADIQHRTKNGYKLFKNVPFASLWLGTAIDSLLDYRRRSEVDLALEGDEADQAMVEHAIQDLEDEDDGGADDAPDDDGGL